METRILKRIFGLGALGAVLAASGLAACTSVMETSTLPYASQGSSGSSHECHSTLGGYSLPKTFIKIEIGKLQVGSTGRFEYALHTLSEVRKADNSKIFCLDYLASSFSDDQIVVNRGKTDGSSSQLLQVVASRAYDRSSYIIRRFIRTIFIGIGNFGARGLTREDLAKVEPMADLSFDPFDVDRMAEINDRIRHYGFCVVLDGYTFNSARGSAEKYCRNPRGYARSDQPFAAAYAHYEATPIPTNSPGVVYRPRAKFDLLIYTKVDPKGPEPWVPRKTQPVYLENISPVLSLRVDRAAFARRKVALMFDDGMLKDVCIFKSSELAEALDIPLEVVKGVARLPTEILQIQYDQISDYNNFLDAEKQLLTKLQTYTTVLNDPTARNGTISAQNPIAFPGATNLTATNGVTLISPPQTELIPGIATLVSAGACPNTTNNNFN